MEATCTVPEPSTISPAQSSPPIALSPSARLRLSGILLAITGALFQRGVLTAHTQAIAWTVIFFVASSAASSAYLTVSEIFPLEIRGLAIAVFYACGTLLGGVSAPLIFGVLSRPLSHESHVWLAAGAALMIVAAVTEATIGIKAERRSWEYITPHSEPVVNSDELSMRPRLRPARSAEHRLRTEPGLPCWPASHSGAGASRRID